MKKETNYVKLGTLLLSTLCTSEVKIVDNVLEPESAMCQTS